MKPQLEDNASKNLNFKENQAGAFQHEIRMVIGI